MSKKEVISGEILEESVVESVVEKPDGKITGRFIHDCVARLNKKLVNQKLRAVRNMDDTISIDIIEGDVVRILEDSGMCAKETFYFLKGLEINLKMNGDVDEGSC